MIRKIYLYHFLLLILSVTLLSCTSGSTGDGETPDAIPVRDIKDRVNANSELIQSLVASGTIAIDSPELSTQGAIEIRIKKPDSVYVEIDGPFGISIVQALITRENFTYYNVQDNRVIRGPSSAINIGAVLRIQLTFDELINSFSGSFRFDENENDDTVHSSIADNLYLLKTGDAGRRFSYYIDPATFLIRKYEITSNNKKVLTVDYANYEHEQVLGRDIYFPNKITISRPDTRQTVYLYYSTDKVNTRNISFRMKIPKSAKETTWN